MLNKANILEQEQFVEEYKELKSNLEPEETIMFMDSCHLSLSTKISHGWIRKGKIKALETTASRTRINLAGAIELNNISKAVIASYKTIDGDCIVNFLNLIRNNSKKSGNIHLVLYRAGYLRSEKNIKTSKLLNI